MTEESFLFPFFILKKIKECEAIHDLFSSLCNELLVFLLL